MLRKPFITAIKMIVDAKAIFSFEIFECDFITFARIIFRQLRE